MIRALLIIEIVWTLIGAMKDLLDLYIGRKFVVDMQRILDRVVLMFILIHLL